MIKPEYEVIRFDNTMSSLSSCDTLCEYQCGSENPGCQGVCVSEACRYECNPD